MKSQTKSPLKDKPLRYVAQSCDEALDDLLYDKVLMYYLVAVIFVISIMFDWLRYFQPRANPPILISIVFGAVFTFCAYKLYRHMKKVKNLD